VDGYATNPVATHLRTRSVGIENRHRARGALSRWRTHEQNAVCADSEVAIAQTIDDMGRPRFARRAVDHDEIVTEALVFFE
jgi:hypothetical protein